MADGVDFLGFDRLISELEQMGLRGEKIEDKALAAFPRITFFELDNRPDRFADNEESESEITFQIDIWSKGSTTAIHKKVNEIMKSIGFSRYAVADLYEDDTQIFHYAMRFVKGVEL